jgi:hypothetical protein
MAKLRACMHNAQKADASNFKQATMHAHSAL